MYKKAIIYVSLFFMMFMVGYNENEVFAAIDGGIEDEIIIEDLDSNIGEEVGVLSINYYNVAFNKTSSTEAKARVTARTTAASKGITSTITLQKYNSSTDSYVNKGTSSKEVDGYSITHEKNFTVNSSGTYRIKVVLTDGSTTQIKYKKLS